MATPARARSLRRYEFEVSLRVRHPDIDPAQITGKLGFVPDHCWAKGDERVAESGGGEAGRRRESYWSARLPQPSERIQKMFAPGPDDAVAARIGAARYAMLAARAIDLPAFLTLHMLELKREREFVQQLARDGDVTVVIEMEAESGAGFRLEPALLRQMTDLGLRLEFELV